MGKTKNQIVNVTEECVDSRIPPIIEDIASHISDQFEMATEMGAFQKNEDDEIIDLIKTLYITCNYEVAVRVFKIFFSMIECNEAVELLSLIHKDNGKDIEKQFVEAFVMVSPRCWLDTLRAVIAEQYDEEVQ